MISCWDDHEVQNDYSGGRSERRHGQRRPLHHAAAQQRLPCVLRADADAPDRDARGCTTRPRFGRTVDLFVLDERQYRAANPCGDKAGPPCAELDQPRTMPGRRPAALSARAVSRSPRRPGRSSPTRSIMSVLKADATSLADFDAWDGLSGRTRGDPAHGREDRRRDLRHRRLPHVHRPATSSARTADGRDRVRAAARSPRSATRRWRRSPARPATARPTIRPSLPPSSRRSSPRTPWFDRLRPDPPRLRALRSHRRASSRRPCEKLETVRQASTTLASREHLHGAQRAAGAASKSAGAG